MPRSKAEKDPEAKENIHKLMDEFVDLTEDMTLAWERYYYEGKKKGAKETRKMALDVKKHLAKIRQAFTTLII